LELSSATVCQSASRFFVDEREKRLRSNLIDLVRLAWTTNYQARATLFAHKEDPARLTPQDKRALRQMSDNTKSKPMKQKMNYSIKSL
jgi:hypothetical protein